MMGRHIRAPRLTKPPKRPHPSKGVTRLTASATVSAALRQSKATTATMSTSITNSQIAPLAWDDPRIDIWLRTSKSNADIDLKANGWVGTQMAVEGNFSELATVHTQPDSLNGNVQRLVWGRGAVGTSAEGWFQHRTFDGMPPWGNPTDGYRARSTVKGPLRSGAGGTTQCFELGNTYWVGVGWILYDDMFSVVSGYGDDVATEIYDHHAWGYPGNAMLSGQQSVAFYCDNTGYTGRVLWNGSAQNLTVSPTGYTGIYNDEEDTANGPWKRVVIAASSKAAALGVPHFYAFKFYFHWNYLNAIKPFITVYRKIGINGALEQLGSWQIPTTYYDPAVNHSSWVQQGIHRWHMPQGGATTRSMDYTGYIIARDDGTITPQQIMDSIMADIPR